MQRNLRPLWLLLALVLVSTLVLQLNVVQPVSAQTASPTATPNDPIWRGFSAVRTAVEAKFKVDLTIVRSWEFEQSEFPNTIDSCLHLEDLTQAHTVYFGWRFLITSLQGKVYEGRTSFDLTVVTVCPDVEEVAAPAPAAASNSNLPAPVAGSAAGGAFELGGQVLSMSLGTFNLMRTAGMTWVKQQVVYNSGDSAGGQAGLINTAHSSGFKILLSVKGDKNQMGDYNGYIAGFATFLGGLASAGADAIEVWNEPNIDREWPTGSVDGGTYTQMLAAAFNAIHGANANTMVVSAAPAPTGYFGGCAAQGCDDDMFMQQMAAAGAANYLDCIGLHYNEGIVAPDQNSNDPRGSYPTYYFSQMLARGYNPFGGKPVCFTELGYVSPEGFSTPLSAGFAWAANTTVAEQAAWLAQAATIAAQSGKVRLMIVFNVDFPAFSGDDPQGGYAIERPGGACPSCTSLGQVMNH